jgi:hypothetical protein
VPQIGYFELQKQDNFNLEQYIKKIKRKAIESLNNQIKNLKPIMDKNLKLLLSPFRKVGIILDSYFTNGKIRALGTGEELVFNPHNFEDQSNTKKSTTDIRSTKDLNN